MFADMNVALQPHQTYMPLALPCMNNVIWRIFPCCVSSISFTLLQYKDEKISYKALEILNPDLYASNCCLDGNNALHLAGTLGFTRVCKEILARGFHKLLGKAGPSPLEIRGRFREAKTSLLPASMAVQTNQFRTAIELVQAMEPE